MLSKILPQPAVVLLSLMSPLAAAPDAADPRLEFFEKKVRPILTENCYNCHSADTKAAGGLRVDDLNGLLDGGDEGPALVRGDVENSLILKRVNHTTERLRMPRESDPLTPGQIADLTTWVRDGAAWPAEKVPDYSQQKEKYPKLRESHWAWQPLVKPPVPALENTDWPAGDVDRFILAKLRENKLEPVADATPEVLLRRITFDLTGLPPSVEEIAEFTKDPSLGRYTGTVDRLLASSAFGERWGRHWLDIARYGESTGPSRNIPYPHAWKYRNYVLDAVNKDIPFNRFVTEQVAGDLLPAADDDERDRLLTATGFLALGVKDVNQRFKVRFQMDNVDEQIDTVTRSVLGVTVSCARCHDHKFDPIPTTDYYSLAGIFTSTDDRAGVRNKMGGNGLDYYDPGMLVRLSSDLPPPDPVEVARLQKNVEETKKEWDAIRGTPEGLKRAANGQPTQRPFRLKYEKAQGELLELTDSAARGLAVHGVTDSKRIGDTQIRIRGEAERLGPEVPRGFLSVFDVPGAPAVNPAQSGRLELAQWLTSPNNPLTPRVAVNRVWQHLFGEGIVTTVDNFGVKGDIPSHPELLDHLASRFIEDGWSVKKLVRELVLTRAYRLGSESTPAQVGADPANRLVWRHSPRRMEAEEVRDSILAVSGRLNLTAPDEAAVKKLRMVEIRDNGKEAADLLKASNQSTNRSLYLPLLRGVTPKSLEAFDPVTQSLVTGKRDATTVPTQALFMLNSTFVLEQSLALAEDVAAEKNKSTDENIAGLYLHSMGREATPAEIERARQFLSDFAGSYDAPAGADETLAVNTTGNDEAPGDNTPVNPDDIPRDDQTIENRSIVAKDNKTAAWMALIQSLFASAEFRFIR
ncbi:PSD1 domain-containing protein [Luteolibacter yonseiensis]|uniref:PSD1 domain-containing protein n=1 Tax=Luteolibacter yonseiensis TaxID=1144680 RepID=A0A934R192_9BACT|nr:PSD1 and planctomycete cytochrome C domain-containing protein [Luteolibacter yonseiensis]MBK1814637.1 PSD1 domain-containing protein [Luteolibacter yonseiensis]